MDENFSNKLFLKQIRIHRSVWFYHTVDASTARLRNREWSICFNHSRFKIPCTSKTNGCSHIKEMPKTSAVNDNFFQIC